MLRLKHGLEYILNNRYLQWMLLLILSFLYLLFFSASTSPLFPDLYIYDSGVFLYEGKCVLNGMRMYVDFFDHKGPFLIWINSLGELIAGRNGVFFIQGLFLFADIIIMNYIAGKYEKKLGNRVIIIIISLIYYAYPLANGNMSEEYCVPFIALSLLFFISDFKDKNDPAYIHSLFYGISIGVAFYTRFNNGVTVCAIVFCIMLFLFIQRKWLDILKHLLAFAVGIGAVIIPVGVFFYLNNSLRDLWFACIGFNLKYSQDYGYIKNITNPKVFAHVVINFFPVIMSLVTFALFVRKRAYKYSMMFIVICNILSLLLGQGYNHYFTVFLPLFSLAVTIVSANLQEGRAIRIIWFGIALIYFVLAVRIIYVNINDYYINCDAQKEYHSVKETLRNIPNDERNEILGLDIPARYYIMGDVYQAYKYGQLYEMWRFIDADVANGVRKYITNEKPVWIMITENMKDDVLRGIINSNYYEYDRNEYFILLHSS